MHMVIWGANLTLWILTISVDTVFTRDLYFKSSYATGLVAYVGAPTYIIWMMIMHVTDRNDEFSAGQFWATFVSWLSYMILMIFYSENVISSLYNYYMIPVVEEIRLKWEQKALSEKAESESSPKSDKHIPDGDEEIDEILDSWIFDENDWD